MEIGLWCVRKMVFMWMRSIYMVDENTLLQRFLECSASSGGGGGGGEEFVYTRVKSRFAAAASK